MEENFKLPENLMTPSLILDEAKMRRNIDRLNTLLAPKNVVLRPHLKTAKSIKVAKQVLANGNGPATVSTLAEAEYFFEAGVKDILYAVGIAPNKLPRVMALREKGCDLSILLDSIEQAEAVVSAKCSSPIPVLIEIDCDGHRGGVLPTDPELIRIGRLLHENGAELRGVLAHAGESYEVYGRNAHAKCAQAECRATTLAAANLKNEGLPCPIVSVGSTPTAHAMEDLTGVTEIRAGVYTFFDLVMAGIGVCSPDDIAISVLTEVVGKQEAKGWILVDAGWMAMSRDRGTASQKIDQGYGMVCDEAGNIMPDLIVSAANQEHGIITLRKNANEKNVPDLPIGTRLRILPNHAKQTNVRLVQNWRMKSPNWIDQLSVCGKNMKKNSSICDLLGQS